MRAEKAGTQRDGQRLFAGLRAEAVAGARKMNLDGSVAHAHALGDPVNAVALRQPAQGVPLPRCQRNALLRRAGQLRRPRMGGGGHQSQLRPARLNPPAIARAGGIGDEVHHRREARLRRAVRDEERTCRMQFPDLPVHLDDLRGPDLAGRWRLERVPSRPDERLRSLRARVEAVVAGRPVMGDPRIRHGRHTLHNTARMNALMTGQVGRPGDGLHPLRGQNNVQGASDAGLIPMFLPDYQTVTDDGVRSAFTEVWGSEDFSNEKGLTVTEIMDAVHDGDIKAMYVLGENPAMSDPDVEHARDALAKLDHLVVQDIFLTETANYADVILPASAFAEKSGTVTNTNRQVQMGRPAVSPPGEAQEDWWIEVELAKRLGLPWDYDSPADVFAEMKQNMASLDNITWDRLSGENAVTYPSLSPDDPGQPIVFGDGFPRAEGRARFTPASVVPPDDLPDADYPMILTTGRQLEHWHTGSMTRRSKVLDAVEPEANCSLHPSTLRKLGVMPGGMIRLPTKRGTIEIMAREDRAVAPDMVFLPFAYVEAAANILTNPAIDPYGKIPEFKYSAVRVEVAERQVAAE